MFKEKLRAARQRNQSFLCVGLDPDPAKIPVADVTAFLREIIDATADLVGAYKPNLAFFEALGPQGCAVLQGTLEAIPKDIPTIGDGKRGDIGDTVRFYAKALFDLYGFDAVTVNAYGGRDALEPFLSRADRGVLVWCRSSNPGARDVQDQALADGRALYEAIAELARSWNQRGNVGLVVGATWPEQLRRVRRLCPDMFILVPGVGAQEGDLEAAVRAALDGEGEGFIINASRQVLYAAEGKGFVHSARRAAQALRARINQVREAALAEASQGRRE